MPSAQRDWFEQWLADHLHLHLQSSEVLAAAITALLGLIVIVATLYGVSYAAHQFRIANTIKYLERYSSPKFKKKVDNVRRLDRERGAYWRVYGLTTDHPDIVADEERVRFARNAKEISNFFDYVGVLMRFGHIDRDLFFSELCDVTISNWMRLRPYIYYARLVRGDPFAAKFRSLFEKAAEALQQEVEGADAAEQKEAAGMALRHLQYALRGVDDGARTGADTQHWFEWLYLEARNWLKHPRGVPKVRADQRLIRPIIQGIGRQPQPR